MFVTPDSYVVQYLDGDCSARIYGQRIVDKVEVETNSKKCHSDSNGSYQMTLA